ncbi:MAG: calcium-binding protein, partial [Planctomycetes bacterium]|nr:calcium-binding protein [Planctomycetota bacterium]
LADDGVDGNGILRISSADSSEAVEFRAPTTSVVVDAAGGDDTITVEPLDSLFAAGLTLNAGDGRDVVDASAAGVAVSLAGGSGDDTLTGGGGNDTIDGGADSDVVTLTADIDMTLINGTLIGRGVDQLTNIEQAVLTGGPGANVLDASAFTLGPVTLDGAAGDDTLIGGADNDSLIGGDGQDQVRQTVDGDQTLSDTLLTGRGQDTLASIETAWLTGGAGANVLKATGFTVGPVTLDGADGDDTLISGGGSDSLIGGTGTDLVRQVADTDQTLTDTLLTGYGDDTLVGIEQAELVGGAGNNRLDASAFTTGLVTLNGVDGRNTLIGSAGPDTLLGGIGEDSIVGLGGDDSLAGGEGNDTLDGGTGSDTLSGQLVRIRSWAARATTRCWAATTTTRFPARRATTVSTAKPVGTCWSKAATWTSL